MAILGPGLIGSSVAQAAHGRELVGSVAVFARREETRRACLAQPWCTEAHETPAGALAGADFVLLATPVARILGLLGEIPPSLAPGALVSDVGSTKETICRRARATLPPGTIFVGAHPMAGSEASGMEHGRPDLFVGAPCILTPTPGTPEVAVHRLETFWRGLGAEVLRLDPETHDARVAEVSHVPHLAAAALVLASLTRHPEGAALAGSGLRDTTRVASGNPALWREIVSENRAAILRALAEFGESLEALREAIARGDDGEVERYLREARQTREQWLATRNDP